MEKFLHATLFFVILISFTASAQNVGIGISNPNASAKLDISSTDHGLLIPRMTTSNINLIVSPAKGLLVYDSTLNQLMVNIGTPVVPNWQTAVIFNGWNLTGNSGTGPAGQFVGTTDTSALYFRANNIQIGELHPGTGNIFLGLRAGQNTAAAFGGRGNVGIGTDALTLNLGGNQLTALGDSALYNNGQHHKFTVDGGVSNTAIGYQSMFSNASGAYNSAIGVASLYSNTTGLYNVADGMNALYHNQEGGQNTAIGAFSLFQNQGSYNTAIGYTALLSNANGQDNTAIGAYALTSNTNGQENTVTGKFGLYSNSSGNGNTSDGVNSLYTNTNGIENTAVGENAAYYNDGGSYNTAVGTNSLHNTTNSQFNTALGYNAGSSYDMGYNNTILGANCDINAFGLFNCIAIGQAVTCDGSSEARIGNSATVSIGGYADWSNISDGRYKKDLREDVIGLNFIMKLRPVTYYLDATGLSNKLNEGHGKELNAFAKQAISEKERMRLSGFVAQEVETAAKETNYDFSGVDKPNNENGLYALRYSNFVVPLVKAVQELNTTINKQQAIIEDLQKRLQLLEEAKKVAVQ
jgi:hypothetical protein